MRDFVLLFAIVGLATAGPSRADEIARERQAMRVLDEFMAAFNARDERAWAETLHFPHVRIASGVTRLDLTADAMLASFDFERFAKQFGWHRSAWLSRKVVQSGPDKVHVAVRFARYREDGSIIAEFDSLYIVTRHDERWAVAGRSSFAP